MGCSNDGIKTISKKAEYSYLPQNIAYIWAEYVSDCQKDGELVIEMNTKNLEYNGKVTTFDYIIRGNYIEPGFPLYIILHNGGIGQSGFNNGEYLKAKFRYVSSVKFGILLGIKGINDLSNMHYTNESIILLDRIIKNFIAFHQVNPNKVYLIGIGMGGDAVYQIVNLLPSKFAAAVVVSGHSYKKNLKNVINVPILIQVGEKDFLYDRNKDAVFTYKRIKDFSDNFNQRMISLNEKKDIQENFVANNSEIKEDERNVECYIHIGKGNNLIDYDKGFREISIIENPINWLTQMGNNSTIEQNVNSISFLNKHIRNPFPKNLFWDLSIILKIPEIKGAKSSIGDMGKGTFSKEGNNTKNGTGTKDGFFQYMTTTANQDMRRKIKMKYNQYFYWLEIGTIDITEIGGLEIIVRLDSKNNSIYIDSPIRYLRILLNNRMIEMSKEVKIYYKGQFKSINLTHNFQTERRTLLERGDYNYIFSACIIFECKDLEHFKIGQYDEISERVG